ncbi:TetR family transcriptional regulator [Caballeronia novacaledonica]|uniref:TetR family transcriptional regulator n=1 Tax=Caballeronia novacaledonica TaxID=1544861 RepID=A0A2U3I585_9BURK|nr:TetR/AcrR family transcriptional regulator [Caballeronia novacaledonica]SPB15316.1 TetR family transcriptional regulator [Caballeronia novacaledonica]
MGHSQAQKVETRQRIVEVAARRLRERGIDGASIADLMKEAGLTVGGFYKHFASRDELVREAFEYALRDIESWQASIPTEPQRAMRAYLSEAHRDNIERACPISALVNDVSRCAGATREVYSARVEKIVGLIARASPALLDATKRAEAFHILSACVGAVTLSRAVSDPELSSRILDGALSGVLAMLSPERDAGQESA